MSTQKNIFSHGTRDNHTRGKVSDFLAEKMTAGSQLSVVSAYFTIYAYDALAKQLDQIDHLNFLFGENTAKTRSNQPALATASILGQPPRRLPSLGLHHLCSKVSAV
jgi:hypothetical protein